MIGMYYFVQYDLDIDVRLSLGSISLGLSPVRCHKSHLS